jgi:hypothetical protein
VKHSAADLHYKGAPAPEYRDLSYSSGAHSVEARTVHESERVLFELRRLDTGDLVHRYPTEAAALAFVRDVIRIGGHDQAAIFALDACNPDGQVRRVAEGVALVQRALEYRVM